MFFLNAVRGNPKSVVNLQSGAIQKVRQNHRLPRGFVKSARNDGYFAHTP